MKRLAMASATLLLGGLAYSQSINPVRIQRTGIVRQGHEHVHARNGQTVNWDVDTGATSWYVIFTGPTPCAGGVREFGTERGLPRSCRVQNATPGTYKYSSSDTRAGQKHDPDVIIDE